MEWDELPAAVQIRVVALAAAAVGAAPPAQIPPGLAAVARFAPAKRASRGAAPLARAVQSDPGFRASVAQLARNQQETPDGDVGVVTLAYLLNRPIPADAVARLTESVGLAAADRRIAELEGEVAALTGTVARLRAAADRQADPGTTEEADRLRGRLRAQGTRVREAEQTAQRLQLDADRRIAELTAALSDAEAALTAAEKRAQQADELAERATKSLAAHRESGEQRTSAGDRRIDLLLSTISAAATGLRREWDVSTQGELPADVVARQLSPVPVAARQIGDPARLAEFLSLPAAHLIVDGYNVSKTGYGELSLADQRDRLIRSLSGLSARTSAEITVVFDGAAVAVAPPAGRKIRVLFSPPGVIADDVIRRLVAAEPTGRPLVVATSDRAVAVDVARAGVRTAGSDVLLSLIGR